MEHWARTVLRDPWVFSVRRHLVLFVIRGSWYLIRRYPLGHYRLFLSVSSVEPISRYAFQDSLRRQHYSSGCVGCTVHFRTICDATAVHSTLVAQATLRLRAFVSAMGLIQIVHGHDSSLRTAISFLSCVITLPFLHKSVPFSFFTCFLRRSKPIDFCAQQVRPLWPAGPTQLPEQRQRTRHPFGT